MKDRKLPRTMPLFLMGGVLTALGCLAIATPSLAGTWVVAVIGVTLLIAGVIQILTGWWAENWSSKLPAMIIGLVSTVCGAGLLAEPFIGSAMIVWVMSIFFLVGGCWKMITAFSYRPAKGWILFFLSGLIALGLGYVMFQQTPENDLKIIGFLAGIDFLLTGMSILAVAFTIRQLQAALQHTAAQIANRQDSDVPLTD